MKVLLRGVWLGLIDGLDWFGRQVGGLGWFVAGAVYGGLIMLWLLR